MTPDQIMAGVIAEHSAQNIRVDALMITLTQRVVARDTEGISDVVNNAIAELGGDTQGDRQETSDAGVVDGSDRESDD